MYQDPQILNSLAHRCNISECNLEERAWLVKLIVLIVFMCVHARIHTHTHTFGLFKGLLSDPSTPSWEACSFWIRCLFRACPAFPGSVCVIICHFTGSRGFMVIMKRHLSSNWPSPQMYDKKCPSTTFFSMTRTR